MADCGLKEPPVCLAALPSPREGTAARGGSGGTTSSGDSGGVTVLVGTEEGELLRADATHVEPIVSGRPILSVGDTLRVWEAHSE